MATEENTAVVHRFIDEVINAQPTRNPFLRIPHTQRPRLVFAVQRIEPHRAPRTREDKAVLYLVFNGIMDGRPRP